MIRDGTAGTASRDGLEQCFTRWGNYYEAFRGHNSGQVNTSDLSDGQHANPAYVSDLASRLLGAQPN